MNKNNSGKLSHPKWEWQSGGKAVFSRENTPEEHTVTNKSSLFSSKQVSGRNGDHEWFAFTLCDLLWKVQKSHAANREGSFKRHSMRH